MTENDGLDDEEPTGARPLAPVTVFVSDPSAEAERIAQALRAEGYTVVDVPLSMLVARVAVQRPRVIVIDADAHGAVDAITRVREIDESDAVDMLLLGKVDEALVGAELAALAREESGYYERPVVVAEILQRIGEITGGAPREPVRRSTVPPSAPPAARAPSLSPPSMRSQSTPPSRPTPPPRVSLLAGQGMDLAPGSLRRPTVAQSPLSNELEMLLLEAEQRIGGQMGASESMLPSPEEEIEAVLPPEVLASLDEPLEDDEDDAVAEAPAGHRGTTTGPGKITTGNTGGGSSTGGGGRTPNPPVAALAAIPDASIPPPKTHGGTHEGSTGASTTGVGPARSPTVAPKIVDPRDEPPPPPVEIRARESPRPAPPEVGMAPPRSRVLERPALSHKVVLGDGDAPRLVADAVAGRGSGVLAFESAEGVRRLAFRDGDLVFAASSIEAESLLPFLAARGELPRDRVAQLAGRVPPFGRHAGAALVAHGYLRQDALWSVLRAHAEWVIARAVATNDGTAGFEDDPPARVKGEPSVFGASPGSEVFVEVVRRVVAPGDAVARLGGEGARIGLGPNVQLQNECALGGAETDWLARAKGQTVGEAVAFAADPDFASVLYALTLLGVCEVVRPMGAPIASPRPRAEEPRGAVETLDEDAVRARVRARLQLVDEGDYFAVLGVTRDATSYEVKRAFLELRRAFEPSKLLTPGLVDLKDDVQRIASVLDEAYEILRDVARRERYRRAIEAVPR